NEKGFSCLTGQRSSAGVGDGTRHHYGSFLSSFFKEGLDCKQGGLGIQRIGYRFDEEYVDPTVKQPACLFSEGRHEFIKSYGAVAWVVDVGRHGGDFVCRANGACNEPRLCRVF